MIGTAERRLPLASVVGRIEKSPSLRARTTIVAAVVSVPPVLPLSGPEIVWPIGGVNVAGFSRPTGRSARGQFRCASKK